MKKYTIGVDVGGTNIKLGLVSSSGRVKDRTRLETKRFSSDKKKLIGAVCDAILDLIKKNNLKKKNIMGIAFGLPGLINPKEGVVEFLPNIPGWKNVPLKKLVQTRLKIPTFLENDVNLIALGEWKFGAGKGQRNLICMTLGTGVGSGLILNGELYRGQDFVAGELGHVPLNENGPRCNCGGEGCFEVYVGNKKLVQKASLMFKKPMRIEDTFALAKKGNRKALKFWEEVGTHIGNGLVGVVNLLNPQMVIIGGGVSNNFRFLKSKVRSVVKNRAMDVQGKAVRIVRAKLGDDAGLIGALVLVKDALEKKK